MRDFYAPHDAAARWRKAGFLPHYDGTNRALIESMEALMIDQVLQCREPSRNSFDSYYASQIKRGGATNA